MHDPFTGEPRPYQMPAGGRGYTRPPSLISLWSTAPFLLNNSVGPFDSSPSVEARMRSFEDSIEQMLWPEKRDRDPVLGDKVPGIIDRTTERSYLRVPAGFLPDDLQPLLGPLHRLRCPGSSAEGGVEIGPIPKGTPVNLLANLELRAGRRRPGRARRARAEAAAASLRELERDLKSAGDAASDEELRQAFAPLAPRDARAEQVPGLRGQPRPLLRHERLQGGARA